jgi:hypothetical protein
MTLVNASVMASSNSPAYNRWAISKVASGPQDIAGSDQGNPNYLGKHSAEAWDLLTPDQRAEILAKRKATPSSHGGNTGRATWNHNQWQGGRGPYHNRRRLRQAQNRHVSNVTVNSSITNPTGIHVSDVTVNSSITNPTGIQPQQAETNTFLTGTSSSRAGTAFGQSYQHISSLQSTLRLVTVSAVARGSTHGE